MSSIQKGPLYPLPVDFVHEARPRRLPPLKGKYQNIGHKSLVNNWTHRKIGIVYAPTKSSGGDKLLDREMPFLIFSPGLGVNPAKYRPLLEAFASHGCVVLNLSSGTKLAQIQAKNIQRIIDYIRKNKGEDARIILAGHSLGGAASVLAARENPTVQGCINLDGELQGKDKSEGLSVPLIQIVADHLKDAGPDDEEWATTKYPFMIKDWIDLHRNSKNSQIKQIKGTSHMDFAADPIGLGALKAHRAATNALVQLL